MADAEQPELKADDRVTVFLGAHVKGHKRGQRRKVDAATAERLVRDGHAKFPKGKK